MSIFASDDFSSGTAGTNLTTDALWIAMAGTAIYSDAARARQSGTTTWAYYRDVAPASADYSAQAVVRALTLISNASIGVGVRCQSGANTLYRARAQATTNTIRLEKVVAGATTLLASASQTWSTATDYVVKLDVSGSTLEVYVNGALAVGPNSDTGITTAGFAGIAGTSGGGSSNTTGWHLDDFQAEEAGGSAANLTIADVSHAHTADSLTLSTDSTLTIADASHAHTADSLTLSTDSTLTVADVSHAHTADSLTLSTDSTLTIADAGHAHTADSLTLSVLPTLTIADVSHAHTSDSLSLTSASTLTVADVSHAHTADSLTLSTDSTLTIADASHAHTADSLTLTDVPTLSIAGLSHRHTADSLTLSSASALAIADMRHRHTAANVTLGGVGAVLRPPGRAVVSAHALASATVECALRGTVTITVEPAT